MNPITLAGKYLDQPLLVAKFSKAVPGILTGGAAAFAIHDTYKAPESEKRKRLVKNIAVLGATVGSALVATRGLKVGGKQIFEGLIDVESVKAVREGQKELIEGFMKNAGTLSEKATKTLNKAKVKVLNLGEVKLLHKELRETETGTKFLKDLIPDPENIDSKEIFGEIGRLSLMGLIPVVGGIAGGIVGDALTEKNWKQMIPDKVKEGSYQYLANIFLCNVGAGAALAAMEQRGITSKAARAAGMVGGIMLTGVIGGSAIANFIGKKFINPIFDKNNGPKEPTNIKSLYSERKPEALDVGLHVDDIATVAVMSGLSWIEPALPILYSISGYRAGIGYRNGDGHHHGHHKKHMHKAVNGYQGHQQPDFVKDFLAKIHNHHKS